MAQEPFRLPDAPQVRQALDYIQQTELQTIEEQIAICQIPAPPFKEHVRAEYLRDRFVDLGLDKVRIDAEGNVIGERPGVAEGPTLVFSAHIDTVFPEGTNTTVKRKGNILRAPGISDDSRGLAVLLSVVQAMREAQVQTTGTIVFVGTVGEEGLGDLRGVRHLFAKSLKGRIDRFISVDRGGHKATFSAVGSNRYRVMFHGAGGHSFSAFGLPSPIHAMGRAIEKISRFEVPTEPKTTYNVGRVGGGTSINSIAYFARMEVDMRSVDPTLLAELDANFQRAIREAVEEENNFRTHEKEVTVEIVSVGQRPAGQQVENAPIVRAVLRADAALGIKAELKASSSDSNIAISLGVPAVTLGGGGLSEGTHSLKESFDTTDSYLGTQRCLLIALVIVGVEGVQKPMPN